MSIHQLRHEETPRAGRTWPVVIVCENFRDPRNTGSAFRLADALGAEALWLTGSTLPPPNRKLSRTARSTEQQVPFVHEPDPEAALVSLKQKGYHLTGLELTNRSVDIRKVDFRQYDRVALVVGAEKNGVSAETLSLLDLIVQVPMYGQNSSMNVSTALAIGLYEIVRQWEGL